MKSTLSWLILSNADYELVKHFPCGTDYAQVKTYWVTDISYFVKNYVEQFQ